jgi:hypothetical protein
VPSGYDAHPPAAHAEVVGREVRLGKEPPKKDARTLQLAKYLPRGAKLPMPPPRVKRSQLVRSWPMYANDRLGDCTCAAVGHVEQVVSAAAGAPESPPEQAVLDLYWATGADDTGRYELDVLNYWRSSGFGPDAEKLIAYAQVNPKKRDLAKLGVQLFGGLYIGVALPLSAQRQRIWAVVRGPSAAPGSWGGHAVNVVDYDRSGLWIVTWGAVLKMTWGFWDKYVDEAYALVHPDWFGADGTSPVDASALKLDALMQDLAAVTS